MNEWYGWLCELLIDTIQHVEKSYHQHKLHFLQLKISKKYVTTAMLLLFTFIITIVPICYLKAR